MTRQEIESAIWVLAAQLADLFDPSEVELAELVIHLGPREETRVDVLRYLAGVVLADRRYPIWPDCRPTDEDREWLASIDQGDTR